MSPGRTHAEAVAGIRQYTAETNTAAITRAISASGISGVLRAVRYYGGRQANGGITAVTLLPGIVKASGNTPVLFDSGIRSGTKVIKALALGATAVGICRPYAYGLALDGVEGIVHVLRCILAEADLLMAVDGYPRIADLEPSSLMAVG